MKRDRLDLLRLWIVYNARLKLYQNSPEVYECPEKPEQELTKKEASMLRNWMGNRNEK